MPGQEAIWTALPNGITGEPSQRMLQLSVFVSPRLTDGPPRGLTGAFADWPSCVQPGRVSFRVQAAGGQPVTATVVGEPPDSALWTALFGASTKVVPHEFHDPAAAQQVFSSYPVSRLHDELKASHQQLITDNSALRLDRDRIRNAFRPLFAAASPHPAARPGRTRTAPDGDTAGPDTLRRLHAETSLDLLRHDPATGLDTRIAEAATVAGRLAAAAPGTPVPLIADSDDPVAPYAQLAAFHRAAARPVSAPLTGPPPELDFHQTLHLLADYPALMRRLGLVIDLQVPIGALPHSAEDEASQRVQVLPAFTPAVDVACHSPFTAYHLAGNVLFAPAPATTGPPAPPGPPGSPIPLPSTEVFHGLLNLRPDGPHTAVQLDLDGGALKVLGMVAEETRQLGAPRPAEPSGVPSLRSGGVTIARSGHAEALMGRMAVAGTHQGNLTLGQEVTFFAEDLVRGYRFDVRDKASGAWRSLHERVGTYVFPAHPGGPLTLTIRDEGAVQPAITRPPGPDGVRPDPDAPLHIHESLAHWKGWSLAAPRPGKTVTPEGPALVESAPPPDGVPVKATFTPAPGSLPRLRYGESYQFRARVVDLAGNSLSLSEADDRLRLIGSEDFELPVLPSGDSWFTYRRYEPVPAPVTVPRERFTDSETTDRLVIRSRAHTTASQYASALTAEAAAANPSAAVRYRGVSERHLVPPKASLATVETHGRLDAAFDAAAAQNTVYLTAVKEKGSLNDSAILDTATGRSEPIPDSTDIDPLTGRPATRRSVELVVTGTTASGKRGYAVHHEAQLRLPYLPDPAVDGAALFGVPGLPLDGKQAGVLDASGKLTFTPSTLAPATLALLGGSVLHIGFGGTWPDRLPFRLQLADPADIGAAPGTAPAPRWDAVGRVLTVYLAPAEQATVRLSSFLSLRNDVTDLDALGLWHWINEFNHGEGHDPTTDTVQTALQGGHRMITPFRSLTLVHAVEAPLHAPTLTGLHAARPPAAPFAYLGGTVAVHGKSTAKIDLMASWSETDDSGDGGPVVRTRGAHVYDVPIALPGDPDIGADEPPGVVAIGTYAPDTDAITLAAPAPDDGSGRTYLSRHDFGDTKYRRVAYRAVATSRFREYFPSAVADDPARITATGEAVEVDVLSSARPPVPVVVSALPTFSWTRTGIPGESRQSVRRSGVRVYLDRPWCASGEGEMLGVVLTDAAFHPPIAELEPYVSQWGQNPAFTGGDGLSAPSLVDFPAALTQVTRYALDELVDLGGLGPASRMVAVAAHAVDFDPDRKLWYSDIDITGAPDAFYSPHVRLALARYQPKSLPGMALSPVVRTDFVQVPPQRTVTVAPVPGSVGVLDVTVTGITYGATSWLADPPDEDGKDYNPQRDLVSVSLQQRMPGIGDDLGWQHGETVRPASVVAVGAAPAPAGTPLWQGRVHVPAGAAPGEFRLLIEEYERYTSDLSEQHTSQVSDDDDPEDRPHRHTHTETVTFFPGAERVVFAEAIPL